MIMDQDAIFELIPHRDPFVFVNEVESLDDKSIVARYHATADKPFFKGHFPTEKVMPGVLQLEALAQAGAILALAKDEFRGRLVYFGGMENVRFKRKVVPGETLTLRVYLRALRGRIGFADGEAYVGDDLCCRARLSFVVGEQVESR